MDFLEEDIVILSANPTCILRWIEILHKWRMYVSLRDENLIQALDASLDYIIGQKLNQKKKKRNALTCIGKVITFLLCQDMSSYDIN